MSETCKNCGQHKKNYVHESRRGHMYEPQNESMFTTTGIISVIFERFRVDAHIAYPNLDIIYDKVVICGENIGKYVNKQFFDDCDKYILKHFIDEIHSFGERKRKEMEG